MRGGLGLHARGRTRVGGLRLWPWGGLGRPAQRPPWTQSSLSLEVGGLSHLLLGTHRTVVLGGRAPPKVLLL